MNITEILHSFAGDEQVKAVIILIAADIILGIVAAVVNPGQHFSLTYIANFLRNDVLGKVVPWFALFALGKTSGADVLGVDFSTIADGAFVLVGAALVGSLLSSLSDLGLPIPAELGGRVTAPSTPAAQ
jgi:hypothetical protein